MECHAGNAPRQSQAGEWELRPLLCSSLSAPLHYLRAFDMSQAATRKTGRRLPMQAKGSGDVMHEKGGE